MADTQTIVFRISDKFVRQGLTREKISGFADKLKLSVSEACSMLILKGFEHEALSSELEKALFELSEERKRQQEPVYPDNFDSVVKDVVAIKKVMQKSGIEF